MVMTYVILETGGIIVTLYWVSAEWEHEAKLVACKSTIYATKNEFFSIEDYENVREQIKKEVFHDNPILSSIAEGPFISCIYRINPESKMFNGAISSFIISFIANTSEEMIKAQSEISISLMLNDFNKNKPKDLLVAFTFFLAEVRKKVENLCEKKFEDFTIEYIYEMT